MDMTVDSEPESALPKAFCPAKQTKKLGTPHSCQKVASLAKNLLYTCNCLYIFTEGCFLLRNQY